MGSDLYIGEITKFLNHDENTLSLINYAIHRPMALRSPLFFDILTFSIQINIQYLLITAIKTMGSRR